MMRVSWRIWLLAALVLIYGVRAGTGIRGGVALALGVPLAKAGNLQKALGWLEHAGVGQERYEAAWYAAECHLGLWDAAEDPQSPEARAHLSEAARLHAQGLRISPAGAWSWSGLAGVYDRLERMERAGVKRELPLEALAAGEWGLLGPYGVVASGFHRAAVASAPNLFTFRDQMALFYWDLGLREAALNAVRQSARVQPDYFVHAYRLQPEVPREFLDAFAEAAEAALGRTPFLERQRHLVSLGKLEILRGGHERAVSFLERALDEPGDALNRAEAQFHLGRALVELGRYDEALAHLDAAGSHPRFYRAALALRVGVLERQGDLNGALETARQLRWLEPGEPRWCYQFARLALRAGDCPAAEEALRWARVLRRGDPEPELRLANLYLECGEAQRAAAQIERLENADGVPESTVAALRDRLARMREVGTP